MGSVLQQDFYGATSAPRPFLGQSPATPPTPVHLSVSPATPDPDPSVCQASPLCLSPNTSPQALPRLLSLPQGKRRQKHEGPHTIRCTEKVRATRQRARRGSRGLALELVPSKAPQLATSLPQVLRGLTGGLQQARARRRGPALLSARWRSRVRARGPSQPYGDSCCHGNSTPSNGIPALLGWVR